MLDTPSPVLDTFSPVSNTLDRVFSTSVTVLDTPSPVSMIKFGMQHILAGSDGEEIRRLQVPKFTDV